MEKKCRPSESYKFAFSLFRGWVWRTGETRREWKTSKIHQILFHQFRALDYFFFTSSGSDSSYSPSSPPPSSSLVVWQLCSNNKLVLFFNCTSFFKPNQQHQLSSLTCSYTINESARAENSLFPSLSSHLFLQKTVSFLLFLVQEWDGVQEERERERHSFMNWILKRRKKVSEGGEEEEERMEKVSRNRITIR